MSVFDIFLLETNTDEENVQKTKNEVKKGERAEHFVVRNQL